MAEPKKAAAYTDPPRDLAFDADLETFLAYYRMALHNGTPTHLFDFYKSLASRYPDIESAVALRQAGVESALVSVLPANQSQEAQRNRDRFLAVWDTIGGRSESLSHFALTVPFHGIGLAEIAWVRDGAEWRPEYLATLDPTATAWTTRHGMGARHGVGPDRLLVRVGPWAYEPLMPDKWVVARRRTHGSIADHALMRATAAFVLFALSGWRSYVQYVEAYGVPVPEFQIGDYADTEAMKFAEAALANWGKKGLITSVSDKIKIVIHDAVSMARVGSTDVQARFLNQISDAIGRQWNGGALVQGTGAGGSSYALGQVHMSAQAQLYQADARVIENAYRSGLVEPYFRINGISGPMPVVQVLTRAEIAARVSLLGYQAQNGYRVRDTTLLSEWMGIAMYDAGASGSQASNTEAS